MTTHEVPQHHNPDATPAETAAANPRRYLIYLISVPFGVLLAGLAWALLVLGQIGAPVESSRWSGEIWQQKSAIAAAELAPKLLVVAGSSTLFNVRTEQIATTTGVPTVNFGTAAALQLEYLLWKTKQSLRDGDVVYLPLEYELFDYDGVPTGFLLDHIYARDPAYLNSLNPWRWTYHLISLPWSRLYQGYRALVIPPQPLPGPDGYEAKTLNAYGDETINAGPARSEKLDRDNPSPILSGGLPSDSRSWQVLADFIAWAHAHDITVVGGFPATIAHRDYPPEVVREVGDTITGFYRDLGVPVIGRPENGLFLKSFFFDTRYHLLSGHSEAYPRILTEQLTPYLEPLLAAQPADRP